MPDTYEIVIIGGGPAGLTAGLYTSRVGLKSLLVEGGMFGGQMVNARIIENYPGFPNGVSGFDLAALMQEQASKFGLETLNTTVTGIEPGESYRIATSDETYEARAVIIAAGSEYRKLGVSGEDLYTGRGVSYCATCDGPLFRDETVAVIGGGDTAATDALELTQHASKVFLIHRRDELRASYILQQRLLLHPKVEPIWNTVVRELKGDAMLHSATLSNVKTGEVSELPVAGVFVAVGLTPRSEPFANLLEIADTGHVVTDNILRTSVPGIFAAGDIRKDSSRQIAGAVGDGVMAALSAFRYVKGGA